MGEGFCSNCGKAVTTTDAFCGGCGAGLLSTPLTSALGTRQPQHRSRLRVLIGILVAFLIVGGGIAGFVVPDILNPPSGASGTLIAPLGKSTTPVAASWSAACQALDLANAGEWSQAADGWDHAASEASTQEKAIAEAGNAQESFGILAKDALAVARLPSVQEAWKYAWVDSSIGQYNQDLSSASAYLTGCGQVYPAFTPPSACNAVQAGKRSQWTNATTEWTDAKNQAGPDQLHNAVSSFDLLATDTTLLAAPGVGADVMARYQADLTAAKPYLKGC